MTERIGNKLTLSIETAIRGGSLSLLDNGEEIDCWLGRAEVSKAEDVLEQINNIFERNNFKKESLKLIVVSNGTGSATGIKIGISFAKGLSKALGCEFVQASVLKSLLLKAKKMSGPIVTALPIGKDLICRQIFRDLASILSGENGSQVSSEKDFIELVTKGEYSQVICHSKVFALLKSNTNITDQTTVIDGGENLAKLIATYIINGSDNDLEM